MINPQIINCMRKLFIALWGIVVTLSGCETLQDTGSSVAYHRSFIAAYYDYGNIDIEVRDFWESAEITYDRIFVYPNVLNIYSQDSKEEELKSKYEEFATLNNDVNFNREMSVLGSHSYANITSTENISSIDLICLEDIDLEHPSGASVEDLFMIYSTTPYYYIQSAYTEEYQYKGIYKLLNDISAEDMYLMGSGFYSRLILFQLYPSDGINCPAFGKKLRLTLNYENQYPISKEFVFAKGEY